MITAEQISAVRQIWPAWDDLTIRRHLQQRAALMGAPRFAQTWCSQCGRENGPADAGTSHCSDHTPRGAM